MDYQAIIQQQAAIAAENLSKQLPCTLAEAKAQVEQLKNQSLTENKKNRKK